MTNQGKKCMSCHLEDDRGGGTGQADSAAARPIITVIPINRNLIINSITFIKFALLMKSIEM